MPWAPIWRVNDRGVNIAIVADVTPNYSRLPDHAARRRILIRIFSILVCAFGVLTFLHCGLIEYLNQRAGSVLPFAPLPPDMHDTWREVPTGERAYRRETLERTGDPLWETRPLTPAEQADFAAWRRKGQAWNNLADAVAFACFLIPLIPLILIGALVLVIYHYAQKWRIVLAGVGVLQFAAIAVFVHLGLLDAISRSMP